MDIASLHFLDNIYLNALLVFAGFFLVSRLFVYLAEKVFLELTKRTATKIDDRIVAETSGSVSILLVVIGLRIAAEIINLKNSVYYTITNIIESFIVLAATYVLIKIVVIIIEEWGSKWASKTESKADDQLVILFVKFTKVVGWLLGGIYVLNVWNIAVGPILASLGVAGIAVAFALQQSLSNVFGGISMLVDKAVKVDDVIELDDGTSGRIIDIGIRSTKLRTWDNEVIIIPNGELANSKLKNIVLPEPKVRVNVPFGVAYGSSVQEVKKLVLSEVKKVEGYIEDPAPAVMFMEMGSSSLNFKAYFWIDSYSKRFAAKDEANTLIYDALNKKGISIPFPQMDVHIKEHKK